MKIRSLALLGTALPWLGWAALAADAPATAPAAATAEDEQKTDGSVTVGGQHIDYQAIAGTLVVHPKGWDDAQAKDDKEAKPADKPADKPAPAAAAAEDNNPTAEAAMSFVAYLKKGAGPNRPLTFLYNGGPGSSTIWLHMGSFGPKHVINVDARHPPAAPYELVNNDESLLDATDLVFVDAPGTGFGRLRGKDKEKSFWGVDADAYAFSQFITRFLSKYGRWNSPKYLFGESYGTTRSANLINLLENDESVDFNGVILLSQALSFDTFPDYPESNPGNELSYELALPTYATTAWYHKRLPNPPKDLATLVDQIEAFTLGDYASALAQGSALPDDKRKAIAAKLHEFTGLPIETILRADLRISSPVFLKGLNDADGNTTGRLDSRYVGPTLDLLSRGADYDPQSASISSAYVSAFNDYVRKTLNYGQNKSYRPIIDVEKQWNFLHTPPGADQPVPQAVNVMPDLANAMKVNPNLKVQLNMGYYDMATPFMQGVYEMRHLPIPDKLRGNIEFQFYESGHMVYVNDAARKAMHNNVVAFIQKTSGAK